jgi:hypothetical protein
MKGEKKQFRALPSARGNKIMDNMVINARGGPMFTLRYFMWQRQHIFQASAAHLAQSFLEPLDAHLAPNAFLVGFRVADNAEDAESICVSPEDCRFRPEVSADVPQLTEELAKADPQFSWRCSAPSDPDTYQHMAVRHGLRRAVEQTLEQADSGSAFLASEPNFVNGYSVLVVGRIERARSEAHWRPNDARRHAVRDTTPQSATPTSRRRPIG